LKLVRKRRTLFIACAWAHKHKSITVASSMTLGLLSSLMNLGLPYAHIIRMPSTPSSSLGFPHHLPSPTYLVQECWVIHNYFAPDEKIYKD
jgi:hypothetical protein